MKNKTFLIFLLLFVNQLVKGQSYLSYFIGNSVDKITNPDGGVCLMGGSVENDEAMKWFIKRANGGDVLVLRASGSDGYNNYLFSDLGVELNSVESIVFKDSIASYDPYIQQRVQQAEAIWMAGGDQWNYVSYWRNSPIDSLINDGIKNRNIVIGGTSAGMAVQGGFYFSARNNTVTSATALANPYDERITVDSADFIQNNYLLDVVTDTHYGQRNRKGRHLTFLARILVDAGFKAKGIACNERTAVCIDYKGIARVYGSFPDYKTTAYFIQPNCELEDFQPENCTPNTPLHWNIDGKAIKVYAVDGTMDGTKYFDLSDWKTGQGGRWGNWYVDRGTLIEETGTPIDCHSPLDEKK